MILDFEKEMEKHRRLFLDFNVYALIETDNNPGKKK